MTTPTNPASLLAPLLALVELSKKATHGELEAVLAEGIPCVGTVLADESGGKGFIIGEGWSMEDCEFAAAACNFIRKHEHDLLESLAAQRVEVSAWRVLNIGGDGKHGGWHEYKSGDLHLAGLIAEESEIEYAYKHPPQAQASAGDAWLPMVTAPKDGTAVLLLAATGLPEQVDRLSGIQFVGRHAGGLSAWCFAAPVGYGGIPDEWLAGWQPLPAPPALAAKP